MSHVDKDSPGPLKKIFFTITLFEKCAGGDQSTGRVQVADVRLRLAAVLFQPSCVERSTTPFRVRPAVRHEDKTTAELHRGATATASLQDRNPLPLKCPPPKKLRDPNHFPTFWDNCNCVTVTPGRTSSTLRGPHFVQIHHIHFLKRKPNVWIANPPPTFRGSAEPT